MPKTDLFDLVMKITSPDPAATTIQINGYTAWHRSRALYEAKNFIKVYAADRTKLWVST